MRYRIYLVCLFLLPAAVASGQNEQAAKDMYGDPLPAGTISRLGTVRFRHPSTIVFAAFLPGGKSVLSVSDDGVICAWEFPSGKEIRRVKGFDSSSTMVTSASLSPNGKHLTAFCDDGYLRVVDWAGGKVLGKVAHAGSGTSNSSTASSSAFSRSLARSLGKTTFAGAGPVYSPDGQTLMLPASSRVLQFVDLPNGKEIGPNLGHTEALTSISFSADGKQVLTKNAKSTHTWNVMDGKDLGSFTIKLPPTPGSPTVISPDGRIGVTVARFQTPAVAKAAKSRQATLFDTATGKELGKVELEAEITPIHRKPIAFSPDGKFLAVNGGSDRELIEIHEVPSGKLLRTLDAGASVRGGKGWAAPLGVGPGGGGFPIGGGGKGGRFGAATQKLLFSPDGKAIAFQAGSGAAIIVLDAVTGRQLASIDSSPVLQGVFTPDGRCLALEKTDGTVTLYELATGQPRSKFGVPWSTRAVINDDTLADFLFGPTTLVSRAKGSVAISPDGKVLALSGAGGVVQILDVWTGKELTVLKGHTMSVNALAFSRDGKSLASASDDTTALIWDMTRIARPALPARALKAGDLEGWWQTLADKEADKSFAAMGAFASAPKETVDWIKERVKPAPLLDIKHIAQLMQELDDNVFKVRDRASAELLKMGELLVPMLDKARDGTQAPESRRRLEELRKKLLAVGLQGDRLRNIRAIEILEQIGTSPARQVLQSLAKGAPGALITASAQEALKR